MKYSSYVDINKPLGVVVDFYSDSNNLKKWQDGFVKKEWIYGNPMDNGAVSKLYYSYGKRNMVLTETIISNRLPDSFEAEYHHKHMDNTMKCQFIPLDASRTRYMYEFEYTRMNWMPRLMAILFPGMYRRQGEKWMNQFKEQIEKQ